MVACELPVASVVYFANVPEIAQVERRTATRRTEAILIILFFFILKNSFRIDFYSSLMRGRKFAGSAGFAASAAAMYIPTPDVASEGRITMKL
jgi:hypothetical protein